MDIWSRTFAEKFRITFKVCVRTERGKGGSLMWTGGDRDEGVKITENVRTSVMHGPIS